MRSRTITLLAVWDRRLGATALEAAQGRSPTFELFMPSAADPEAYPLVDREGRFDESWRWSPIWLRGDALVRTEDVDLRGASAATVFRVMRRTLREKGAVEIEWERGGHREIQIDRVFSGRMAWYGGLPLSTASAPAAVMLLLRAALWGLSGLGFLFFACLALFAADRGIPPMPIGIRGRARSP